MSNQINIVNIRCMNNIKQSIKLKGKYRLKSLSSFKLTKYGYILLNMPFRLFIAARIQLSLLNSFRNGYTHTHHTSISYKCEISHYHNMPSILHRLIGRLKWTIKTTEQHTHTHTIQLLSCETKLHTACSAIHSTKLANKITKKEKEKENQPNKNQNIHMKWYGLFQKSERVISFVYAIHNYDNK